MFVNVVEVLIKVYSVFFICRNEYVLYVLRFVLIVLLCLCNVRTAKVNRIVFVMIVFIVSVCVKNCGVRYFFNRKSK